MNYKIQKYKLQKYKIQNPKIGLDWIAGQSCEAAAGYQLCPQSLRKLIKNTKYELQNIKIQIIEIQNTKYKNWIGLDCGIEL